MRKEMGGKTLPCWCLAPITIIVAYRDTVSFLFEKSGSKQIVVKVIDNRGIESFLDNQIMNAGEY